jgi:thiamine biosynthesis lipoprotein ApbE
MSPHAAGRVAVALAFGCVFAPARPAPPAAEFAFHHDHVLGTSLDLVVVAPDEAAADAADRAALGEVERLRLVFSTYDPASEVSRLNRTRGPARVSAEMAEVLRAYEHWQRETGFAFSGQVGELVRLWKQAEADGREPPAATLERVAADLRKPGWELDSATNTFTRLTDQPLNLNAVAKGYIVRKAADAARRQAPGVTGLLVNLGGDVLAWGAPPGGAGWAVGVQDPFRHHDNAAPLGGLRLSGRAVASSGGYQRFYTVGGRRYSHLLDPRTGRPADGVAGATVVAADGVTANALATSLCVLAPEEGLKLVAGVPGAECLIVAADGTRFRSPGLRLFEVAAVRAPQEKAAEKKGEPWPDGFRVTVAVELPAIDAKRYRKPYAAVWVEDAKGNPVRTLAVWGNAPKYLKDLSDWWKIGKGDADLVKAVTRATRGPGKYELVWDGKDDKGNALPQGAYTVRVEVHREFGSHLRQSGKIECGAGPAATKFEKNAETGETVVEFNKPEKK